MKNFAVLFLLFSFVSGFCQQKAQVFIAPKKAELNVSAIKKDFYTDIQCIEKPVPGGIPQKTAAMMQKKSAQQPSVQQSSTLPSPYLGRNFFGNPFYSSTPNDNDIAVSNGCKIVSVSNTIIYFHDCAVDSSLGTLSLDAFANPLGLQHEEFDPIVEYDPVSDKFILVCLNGFTDTTSSIIMGFSQTNDPKGNWNLYSIPGNPKNNGLWTDYPMMSLSPTEAFLTVNLLYPDSSWQTGFVETLVWQIKKADGYAGLPLTMQMHDSIMWNGKAIRNLCPARGGSSLYGPNQFFVSNRNFGVSYDTVFVVEISDTINAPGQSVNVKQLNSDKQYSFPPDARQFGSNRFATNDSRNLGAIYQNNKIQYVHNTLDTSTSFCAVYHGVIHNVSSATPTVNGYIVNDTLLDFGYPNISYSGNSATDNSCIINFNHCSGTVHAGCSVIKSDGNGQYSNVLTVKNGTSYVNVLSGFLERWGDYSGSQRKYNDTDKVWMNGYYGYFSGGQRKHGTWIGEISGSPVGVGISTNKEPEAGLVYPNPFKDMVNVKFSLTKNEYLNFVLYDLNGKEVQVLMREYIKAGVNQFSFSLNPLPAGAYVLKIQNNAGDYTYSQQLIKN